MDMNNNIDVNTSTYTEDNADSAEEYTSPDIVSHMQYETNSKKLRYDNNDNMLRKTVYGPTYVPYRGRWPENSVATVYRHVTKRQSKAFI